MSSLLKWKPINEMPSFFDDLRTYPSHLSRLGWDLAVDVFEEGKNVVAEMAVPGIDPDKIDVAVENWMLILAGSREERSEKKDKHYYKKEICSGHFERRISLPAEVDPDKAKASYKDGVLRVSMPKKTSKQITKHKVKVTSNN